MKAYLCKECKYNNNGWCNKYRVNGAKRIEVCSEYNEDSVEDLTEKIIEYRMSVNFLIDNLEFMMDKEDFNIEKLQKRINVVRKFETNLEAK